MSAKVENFYDGVAEGYSEQYERENIQNIQCDYPANYFRLQLLMNSFVKNDIKKVIEVGVGEGTPLATLAKTGIDIFGFDIANKMVERSKKTMKDNGLDPSKIFWGDIQDPTTYLHAVKDGKFDAAMAMGVMPHIDNDDFVLNNIGGLVKKGGKVFIEFRNKLFSLFSFNRHTVDFILNDLLDGVDKSLLKKVEEDLNSRIRIDMPPTRSNDGGQEGVGFDTILSKFHNPFEVIELFNKHNFQDVNVLWYHYHPSMPYLADSMPLQFRKEAIKLEHNPSSWKGMFLCSAFIIEATKV
ncbi:Methyltransferase domain-containing protein [Maridesulfovibrio ferrireducens]|uniref:Methyltransferase domain-containing protein n=1 Tax=Maridesulfovibrio ferrireducens TaxID=246191 RepID=A0A1G9FJV8_9BACT|nr:class I SAM-dependent methyltransferase [Maridesulfovibrio ferrireducens]SDK88680.1 Methyltransferase domain-containing protein [Maridesulfovibrio ferrireducens]